MQREREALVCLTAHAARPSPFALRPALLHYCICKKRYRDAIFAAEREQNLSFLVFLACTGLIVTCLIRKVYVMIISDLPMLLFFVSTFYRTAFFRASYLLSLQLN